MILTLARASGVNPAAIKVMLTLAAALTAVLGFIWYGEHRARSERAKVDAEWMLATERMRVAEGRGRAAADALATQRETQQQQQIEELRDEAKKGDDSTAGPGVRAVIDSLRRQQGSR